MGKVQETDGTGEVTRDTLELGKRDAESHGNRDCNKDCCSHTNVGMGIESHGKANSKRVAIIGTLKKWNK